MRPIQTTVAAACAVLALSAGIATAQTVPPDRTTFVTFSGPVSVPGTTLPAGTYTFKLLNSDTNRHIVQIFNREGTKLFTTLLAVPATRMEPTGDPVITFKETPSDRPPAVHYWYYAGDLAGNELVYPKNQAQLIANASGESVMSVDSTGNSIDDWKAGNMSRVNPDKATAQSPSTTSTTSTTSDTSAAVQKPEASPAPTTPPQTATTAEQSPKPETTPQTAPATTTADQSPRPATAPEPTPAPAAPRMDQSAQPSTPPTTAPAPADTNQPVGTSGHADKSLPKTASELPMVGLIGLLAFGGAVALRAARTV